MLKPVSSSTLFFDDRNEKIQFFENLYCIMPRMQPEMTETMESIHFHAPLRKEVFQTIKNISALDRTKFDDVVIVF